MHIELLPLGKKLAVSKGIPLTDVLYEYGVEFPCAGKGTCGKCRVKLLKGDIPLSKKESKYLKFLEIPENYRLSCCVNIESNITLEVSPFETIFLADESDFDFTPCDGYGIAIDLGTTTIVAQLLDLEEGQVIDVKTALNPQIPYGSDIIARMGFAIQENGEEVLQKLIREKIKELIESFQEDCLKETSKVVLVGNSVMYHIFCGFDLSSLAYYPFTSQRTEICILSSEELGLPLPANSEIVFLPPLGSFVGSDLMAGIVACKMHLSDKFIVLVDLGTNGEIVIGNKDKIVCSSTSAGPAFEGISISNGMRATTGAISSVKMRNNQISVQVIGQERAKGICGSGLIDAIAIFLEHGLIDFTGAILSGEDKIFLTDQVWISQKDIREFQLAKSAIASGVKLLLGSLNISAKEIGKVYLSGAFGNFLSHKNVRRVGLLAFPSNRVTKLGNSALMGAKMFLFLDKEESGKILSKTTHISLEASGEFQETFVDQMFFNNYKNASTIG